MSRWFRFYDEALDDPKVQRLSPHLFKAWVNLLCLAADRNGALPNNDDVAFRLRLSCQDAESVTSDLILAGLIDIGANGERSMHNWAGRQYASDSSAERVRKHREKNKKHACNGDGNVTVTAQNRTEQSRADSDTELVAPLPPMPKTGGQQDFGIGSGKGKFAEAKRAEVREHTLTRAEGLGLPVDEILAEARRSKPDNLDAYFQSICRARLKISLPSASDDFLRTAFKRDGAEAYQKLLSTLSMVP